MDTKIIMTYKSPTGEVKQTDILDMDEKVFRKWLICHLFKMPEDYTAANLVSVKIGDKGTDFTPAIVEPKKK